MFRRICGWDWKCGIFAIGFDTVKVAIDNFSDANKLGQGGFGVVYEANATLLLTLNILSPKSGIALRAKYVLI